MVRRQSCLLASCLLASQVVVVTALQILPGLSRLKGTALFELYLVLQVV